MSYANSRHLSFPFHIGDNGKTAQVGTIENHVRQELIQLLLTNPGERICQPEFGSGLRRMLFENIDPTATGMTKAILTQSLTRWLGNRIILDNLAVSFENEKVEIEIQYRIAGMEESRIMKFQRNGG